MGSEAMENRKKGRGGDIKGFLNVSCVSVSVTRGCSITRTRPAFVVCTHLGTGVEAIPQSPEDHAVLPTRHGLCCGFFALLEWPVGYVCVRTLVDG